MSSGSILSTLSIPSTLSTLVHLAHPLRHVIGRGAAAVDQFLPAGVVTIPDRQAVLAQEILEVQPQFFQAGPRHVGEFDFGFLRRSRGLAPFRDVLHS